MNTYKDLEIYQLAFELSLKVHEMSFKLPSFEIHEQGSQLRRSSKSIKDNIVEGYGRRKYKSEFIRFLIIAHASLLECKSQLETIDCLYKAVQSKELLDQYDQLGAKLYSFIKYVEMNWNNYN